MSMSPQKFSKDFPPLGADVIIIGGGATGASIARDCICYVGLTAHIIRAL